ncbi:hypothetical protein LCGC14_2487160, partial [marine sediment metagenome]
YDVRESVLMPIPLNILAGLVRRLWWNVHLNPWAMTWSDRRVEEARFQAERQGWQPAYDLGHKQGYEAGKTEGFTQGALAQHEYMLKTFEDSAEERKLEREAQERKEDAEAETG